MLKVGHGGIFQVTVNGTVVAKKTFFGFPNEREIVDAVAKVLDSDSGRENRLPEP